jgi:hypothetical protein
MTKNDEKRVLRAISNAGARQKCLPLINNMTDSSMRGTPLLTTNQVSDIERIIKDSASFDDMGNFVISDEQQICAAMLDAISQLSLCLIQVQTRFFDAKADIARLQGLFFLVEEYQGFSEFLNELCCTQNGTYNERLQERAVSIGQLIPYGYNISLKEEGGIGIIDLKLPDDGSSGIFDVIEGVKLKASHFKALINAMRDFMNQERIPIDIIIERLDDIEEEMRSHIQMTKRMLYRTDFEGWEESRTTLAEHANPKLAMMEALPDYDDLSLDQAVYDETLLLLNQESPLTFNLRQELGWKVGSRPTYSKMQ